MIERKKLINQSIYQSMKILLEFEMKWWLSAVGWKWETLESWLVQQEVLSDRCWRRHCFTWMAMVSEVALKCFSTRLAIVWVVLNKSETSSGWRSRKRSTCLRGHTNTSGTTVKEFSTHQRQEVSHQATFQKTSGTENDIKWNETAVSSVSQSGASHNEWQRTRRRIQVDSDTS